MTLIDWCIVLFLAILLVVVGYKTSKMTKGVADFLAANRTGGRYLLSIAQGMAGVGAISVVANFEMYYEAGFTPLWWHGVTCPTIMIIGLCGWVLYRFRETKAMTLGQFFEMRYSKKFRIFAGLVGFITGIINFGIFPSVGALFFIYFCGLPQTITIFGVGVSTFAVIMFVLLGISLYLALSGGQVALIVTDFLQGVFCTLTFIAVSVFLFFYINLDQFSDVAAVVPANASLVNPYKTGNLENFNYFYYLIAIFGFWYFMLAWQGDQGYQCAAKSPHEAKMAKVVSIFRQIGLQQFSFAILPIAAYTLMHHEDFTNQAAKVLSILSHQSNEAVQRQMTVPVALRVVLPLGLKGAFCAAMLAAFVSNADTYLHSWGSIFIQDVILPLRKKAFSPKEHIRYLRLSIFGVAVFIFCFSLLFKHTQAIIMFFAITGTIYLAGAGSVIIGGLYWKKGTTAAAYSAMITGAILGSTGLIIKQVSPKLITLTSQEIMFFACICSIMVYISISLIDPKKNFDLNKLLHRDKKQEAELQVPVKGLKSLKTDRNFTKADKIIYWLSLGYILTFFCIFIIGTTLNFLGKLTFHSWLTYWSTYAWTILIVSCITITWTTIGGFYNLKEMVFKLKTVQRDAADNGTVRDSDNITKEVQIEMKSKDEVYS